MSLSRLAVRIMAMRSILSSAKPASKSLRPAALQGLDIFLDYHCSRTDCNVFFHPPFVSRICRLASAQGLNEGTSMKVGSSSRCPGLCVGRRLSAWNGSHHEPDHDARPRYGPRDACGGNRRRPGSTRRCAPLVRARPGHHRHRRACERRSTHQSTCASLASSGSGSPPATTSRRSGSQASIPRSRWSSASTTRRSTITSRCC